MAHLKRLLVLQMLSFYYLMIAKFLTDVLGRVHREQICSKRPNKLLLIRSGYFISRDLKDFAVKITDEVDEAIVQLLNKKPSRFSSVTRFHEISPFWLLFTIFGEIQFNKLITLPVSSATRFREISPFWLIFIIFGENSI